MFKTKKQLCLPEGVTSIYDLIERAEESAVEAVRDLLRQDSDPSDDSAREFLRERAHEEADTAVTYYDDQWGIVVSNRWWMRMEPAEVAPLYEGSAALDGSDVLDRAILSTAYALAYSVFEDAFIRAYDSIRDNYDSLEDGGDWEAAILQYINNP